MKVNTNGFANDLVTFRGKDDVLTLMIHLGYLAYNSETKTVRIPNEEIRREFQKSIREVSHQETLKRLAYYTYRDHYLQWEELPSGEGYADIVYLPKHDSDWPALVVELKWKESAEGAIAQIRNRKYPESLKGFGSEIVLVGISYDRDARGGDRKHTCRIIRV